MFRSLIILSAIVALFAPTMLFAASDVAGVPSALIWFSKDPFVEGDQVTIFAPLYNSSSYRFRGTLMLRDGSATIGTEQFNLAPATSQLFNFPWKATSGDHAFSLLIASGEFVTGDKSFVDLPIREGTTDMIKRFAPPRQPVAPPASSPTTAESILPDGVKDTQVARYLSTKIPESLSRDMLPVVGGIEAFRHGQAVRATREAQAIISRLPSTAPSGPNIRSGWSVFTEGVAKGEVIHTPWEYTKLFFVLCYQLVTTNVYVFYILCSYILYLIIRLAVSLFR